MKSKLSSNHALVDRVKARQSLAGKYCSFKLAWLQSWSCNLIYIRLPLGAKAPNPIGSLKTIDRHRYAFTTSYARMRFCCATSDCDLYIQEALAGSKGRNMKASYFLVLCTFLSQLNLPKNHNDFVSRLQVDLEQSPFANIQPIN